MQAIIKKQKNGEIFKDVIERVMEIKEDYRSPYSIEITYKDQDGFIYAECVNLDGYTEIEVR